jgi:hypothetical protein
MTWSGLPQLQASTIARLKASASLMALVHGVFDAVPQQQAYPYVVFDEPFELPDRTLGQDGHESSFVLSVFTQDGSMTKLGKGSAGFKLAGEIVEIILRELIDYTNPIVVEGHDLVDLDVVSIEYARENDGITRRADVNLVARLEDAL